MPVCNKGDNYLLFLNLRIPLQSFPRLYLGFEWTTLPFIYPQVHSVLVLDSTYVSDLFGND